MYQFRVIVIPGRENSYLKCKVCGGGRIIAEATNVKYTQMITWEAWPPECGEDGWGACPERWVRGTSPSHVPDASGQKTPGNLLICKIAPNWSDQTTKCRTLIGRASLHAVPAQTFQRSPWTACLFACEPWVLHWGMSTSLCISILPAGINKPKVLCFFVHPDLETIHHVSLSCNSLLRLL